MKPSIHLFAFLLVLAVAGSPRAANEADRARPAAQSIAPYRVVVLPVHAWSGQPVVGALVTNLDNGDVAYSDAHGGAALPTQEYPSGKIRVAVDQPGYVPRFLERSLPVEPCAGDCGDRTWTIRVALDPHDWLITPPVDSGGASYSTEVPTETSFPGSPSEHLQTIEAEVPAGAWNGEYRIGFSPMRHTSFHQLGSEYPVEQAPVAGFSFRFLDPDTRQAVAGEAIQQPVVLRLGAAYALDLAGSIRPATLRRVDPASGALTMAGVVGVALSGGMLEATVDQPGCYQIFVGEEPVEQIPQGQAVRWQIKSFAWREGCSIHSSDPNFDLPIFGCTTYTNGQAETVSTSSQQTRSKTTEASLSLSAEAQAKLPLIGGVDMTAAGSGAVSWTSESIWDTSTEIGSRVFTDPTLCGEVCLTVKLGILCLEEEVLNSGENGNHWVATGTTKEFEVWGPPCVDDSELEPCAGGN